MGVPRALDVLLLSAALLHANDLPAQAFNGRTATEWVADLSSNSSEVREYAMSALVSMGRRAVHASVRALDDERASVREAAATVLGHIGAAAASAAPRLARVKRDSNENVAVAGEAAWLRVQVAVERVPLLIESLQSDEWTVQLAAADVLRQLGEHAAPATPALIALLRDDRKALDVTKSWKPRGLENRYWNVRASAARALGAIGPQQEAQSVAALLDTLDCSSWFAREGAVWALGSFPDDAGKIIPRLVTVMKSDTWSCQREAAATITRLVGGEQEAPFAVAAMNAMIAALKQGEGGVRRLACEFLGTRKGNAADRAVLVLAKMLDASAGKNCQYAVRALHRIGAPAVAAKSELLALHQSLELQGTSRNQSLHRTVIAILADVAPELRSEHAAVDEELRRRAESARPANVRRHEQITKAIAKLQSEDARERSVGMRAVLDLRATEAIPTLVPYLRDERDPRERSFVLHVLTMLDAEQIVPTVQEMLASPDADVQAGAARSLAMFADKESQGRVVEILSERAKTASKDGLFHLGLTGLKGLAPSMERILASSDEPWMRRWGAATALAMLGVQSSAAVVAAMIDEVVENKRMQPREQHEMLLAGLNALLALDAAGYRPVFERFRKHDDDRVRNKALAGLAKLGDKEAVKVASVSPGSDLPAGVTKQLEAITVRLSRVRGCTLASVLQRIRARLDVPIQLAEDVDRKVLEGTFGGYIDFIGFHPNALDLLSCVNRQMFRGGDLVVAYVDGAIVLQRPKALGR